MCVIVLYIGARADLYRTCQVWQLEGWRGRHQRGLCFAVFRVSRGCGQAAAASPSRKVQIRQIVIAPLPSPATPKTPIEHCLLFTHPKSAQLSSTSTSIHWMDGNRYTDYGGCSCKESEVRGLRAGTKGEIPPHARYLYTFRSFGSRSKNSRSMRLSIRFLITAGLGTKRGASCRVTCRLVWLVGGGVGGCV